MENVLELLKQEKYLFVYNFLDERIKENPFLIEAFFEEEIQIELSKKDEETISVINEIINSEFNWLTDMLAQNSFTAIRDNEKFDSITTKIKEKISNEHKENSLVLKENEWTKIKLEHIEKKLPKASIAITFNDDFFKVKAEITDNHFLTGNRSWRYGDGLFLNFALPEGKEKNECIDTQRFYGIGFSIEEDGKPHSTLVNHNGVYSLNRAGGFR